MLSRMRITIRLDDDLMREAKRPVAEQGQAGLQAGGDLDNSAALVDLMEDVDRSSSLR